MRLCQRRLCLQHTPCTPWLTAPSTCHPRKPRMRSTACCPGRQSLKHMLCTTPHPEQNTILRCMKYRLSLGPSPSRPRRLGSLCKWWQHLLSTGLLRSRCKQSLRPGQCQLCLQHMPCTLWLPALSTCRLHKPHIHLTEHRLCRQSLKHMPCTLWLIPPSRCQLRKQRMQSTEHCPSRRCLKHMLCMTAQLQQKTILQCMQHRASPGSNPSRPDHLHSLYKL